MAVCSVSGCQREAAYGEGWKRPPHEPPRAGRLGTEMRLTVKDSAVVLRLCEAHADELMTVAWVPVEDRLRAWGWTPLPPPT